MGGSLENCASCWCVHGGGGDIWLGARANLDGLVEKATEDTLAMLAKAMDDRASKLDLLARAGCG